MQYHIIDIIYVYYSKIKYMVYQCISYFIGLHQIRSCCILHRASAAARLLWCLRASAWLVVAASPPVERSQGPIYR